ncbi:helix-turn-helix domain-containing protein [Aquimarina gracilis]|uniref:Helix-turn-helix domain-containing protein n=1 Tax=Aquimarina gracilis TaxID=874422 RepID=A0ABU5ZT49_9FLAO|nr:helix-turn-helix domain-containing protein [Aquimarina gracilis]MEB3344808.1 helix-turn-helix domain-containing protein [Aquimarina gracilis]
MNHFTTLHEYCKGINIAPPKWEHFDVRTFEENMKTVYQQMLPFKHEFYAIAVKLDGEGFAKTGNYSTENLKATIFFNSPYQILQWDIAPDWEGLYIIFSEDFYRRENEKKQISLDFPFLLVDNTVPIEISDYEAETFIKTLEEIYNEYNNSNEFSEAIVFHHTQVLLNKVARLFKEKVPKNQQTFERRDNDLALVSRFKTLIETSFYPNLGYEHGEPHKVQFYADQLNIHPNHLNAVVKRIASQSASEMIQKHMVSLAKSKLQNTDISVKEVAFELYYNYPNHFANFFKKHTGMTPNQFRKG